MSLCLLWGISLRLRKAQVVLSKQNFENSVNVCTRFNPDVNPVPILLRAAELLHLHLLTALVIFVVDQEYYFKNMRKHLI